jgi:hypothetical protein
MDTERRVEGREHRAAYLGQLERLASGLRGNEQDYLTACFGVEHGKTTLTNGSGESENWGMSRLLELGFRVKPLAELRQHYQGRLDDPRFTASLEGAHALLQQVARTSGEHGLRALADCGTDAINYTFRAGADRILAREDRGIIDELDATQYNILASLPESDPTLFKWLTNLREFERDSGVSFSVFREKNAAAESLLRDKVGGWYTRQEYARREHLIPLAERIETVFQERERRYNSPTTQ